MVWARRELCAPCLGHPPRYLLSPLPLTALLPTPHNSPGPPCLRSAPCAGRPSHMLCMCCSDRDAGARVLVSNTVKHYVGEGERSCVPSLGVRDWATAPCAARVCAASEMRWKPGRKTVPLWGLRAGNIARLWGASLCCICQQVMMQDVSVGTGSSVTHGRRRGLAGCTAECVCTCVDSIGAKQMWPLPRGTAGCLVFVW